jgi:hypothetical protein
MHSGLCSSFYSIQSVLANSSTHFKGLMTKRGRMGEITDQPFGIIDILILCSS